jgi:hypothetical protein
MAQLDLSTQSHNISQRSVSFLYSICKHTKNLLLFAFNLIYKLPINAKNKEMEQLFVALF